MKVFVAGASGAIGRRLLPLLTELDHHVVAMTRSSATARQLLAYGVEPVVADGLDRNAVMTAVMRSEPDVVVHEMTGLTGMTDLRRFDAGGGRPACTTLQVGERGTEVAGDARQRDVHDGDVEQQHHHAQAHRRQRPPLTAHQRASSRSTASLSDHTLK